jgi:hypothetical protein
VGGGESKLRTGWSHSCLPLNICNSYNPVAANVFFYKATTQYPGGIRTHNPIAPVSSVAGGDDTTRLSHQGKWLQMLPILLLIKNYHLNVCWANFSKRNLFQQSQHCFTFICRYVNACTHMLVTSLKNNGSFLPLRYVRLTGLRVAKMQHDNHRIGSVSRGRF